MASFTNEDLKGHILALIPSVDLESTGLKQFIKLLSKKLDGMDLKPYKPFIKQTLTEEIAKMNEEKEEESAESEQGSDDEEEEEQTTPTKKARGGFSQKKEISDELAAFLGQGKMMARTDIVKSLWQYIREHNLQNPANKKEIILDSDMKQVFGCDTFTMFTMNKYIGAHIHPFKPVDLTTSSTPTRPKKRKGSVVLRKQKAQGGYATTLSIVGRTHSSRWQTQFCLDPKWSRPFGSIFDPTTCRIQMTSEKFFVTTNSKPS